MSQLKIVNEQGEVCPLHTVGEIVTKGPHMMKGYWKMEEESEKTIRNGWLHTGDMAFQDEEGYLYLVDRKKDMIITGGFNVYTTVVEKALFEHPKILQAAVIGVPDEKWGEAVKAFVVATQENVNKEELLHHCKIKLAKYEVPKSIDFVNQLPLTAYGKIDKTELRKPYWSGLTRQVN
jgi:acyl-CoA synthetase (AMP-forming)/AMP-acid ligase II